MAPPKPLTNGQRGNETKKVWFIDLYFLFYLLSLSERLRSYCLLPVFGSFSRSKGLEVTTFALTILFTAGIDQAPLRRNAPQWIDILPFVIGVSACAQPILVNGIIRFSDVFGPVWGLRASFILSDVTQFFAVSLYCRLSLGERKGNVNFAERPDIIAWPWFQGSLLVFFFFATILQEHLFHYIIVNFHFGRKAFLTLASCAVSLCMPKFFFFKRLAVLLALASAAFHYVGPLDFLNTKIESEGYAIVDRWESNTGYVSVVDNLKDGFRVLRCDHSLLGGIWMREQSPSVLAEPIYSIFVTLEAVRLAETDVTKDLIPKSPDEEQALFIGLGVGTSPAAFIHHGIPTTIVEIDPAVHAFATKYFDLPTNHTGVIQDATAFVSQKMLSQEGQYDYIVHDVFTGGAEPLDLFTIDFLMGLHAMLNEEGTIAINYAGDLLRPSAASVVRTVLRVFARCRLFRETAPPSEIAGEDMANMVIFCRKAKEEFTFREPTEADFLGSHARQEYLMPQHEVPKKQFMGKGGKVIGTDTIKALRVSQRENAIRHWYTMRGVIPAKVWENY